MADIQLSVIICTYNRVSILQRTLQQVLSPEIGFDNDTMEIIVVNDGEEDVSFLLNLYPSYPLRVVKNRGRGLAAARNTGASYARGEILLFHDDDILPQEGYFQRHISVCQKYKEAICVANRHYPDELISKITHHPFGRYKLLYEYDWKKGVEMTPLEDGLYYTESVAGFSCSMHKSTYMDVGGYIESFPHAGCEDAEFAYRAKKKGYKLIFDEKNICYHNELDRFDLQNWLWRHAIGIKTAVVMCKLHPEGMKHPTWYTNTPLSWNDPPSLKALKLKKIILSRRLFLNFLLRFTHLLEKMKLPDGLLFRLYNALWLGVTYRSFQETYQEMFREGSNRALSVKEKAA